MVADEKHSQISAEIAGQNQAPVLVNDASDSSAENHAGHPPQAKGYRYPVNVRLSSGLTVKST